MKKKAEEIRPQEEVALQEEIAPQEEPASREYVVLRGVDHLPTKRRWESGDALLEGDLPEKTISWLLGKGAIKEVTNGS